MIIAWIIFIAYNVDEYKAMTGSSKANQQENKRKKEKKLNNFVMKRATVFFSFANIRKLVFHASS